MKKCAADSSHYWANDLVKRTVIQALRIKFDKAFTVALSFETSQQHTRQAFQSVGHPPTDTPPALIPKKQSPSNYLSFVF